MTYYEFLVIFDVLRSPLYNSFIVYKRKKKLIILKIITKYTIYPIQLGNKTLMFT